MSTLSQWFDGLRALASTAFQNGLAVLPDLLGAAIVLLLGLGVAHIVRHVIGRLADILNRYLGGLPQGASTARVSVPGGVIRVVGNLGYWLIIVFFASSAARLAHLDSVAGWLQQILAYVPSMVAAGLIVLVGYVVSTLIRDLVVATMTASGAAQAGAAGMFAQGFVLLAALLIAFDQIGVDVTLLVTIFAIVVGVGLLAIAIAFGLGARGLVSNLVGAQDARRQYAPGQSVRLADVEGTILEFTPTGIVIETQDGRMHVPAKVFHEFATTLRMPQ